MDKIKRLELFQRNEAIIKAVKSKAERVCPGAIDLIAVTGSFHSGNYYEKSDLDLLIVINDKSGQNVSKCFILGDTAHDIYCHTWGKLEKMAEYPSPHVIKLLDVDIVYCASEEAEQRYSLLRKNLLEILQRPLDRNDLEKVKRYFQSALEEFARLCIEEDFSHCKYLSSRIIYYIEYVLYILNKAYMKDGIQGIPRELCALKQLPNQFEELYFSLIRADNLTKLRQSARELLKNTDTLISQMEESLLPKKEISAAALCGSYEEIYSNWKNKMRRAADTDDQYLSLMTAASCQAFYDEMFQEYQMERFDLFADFDINDQSRSADCFDSVMERWRELYKTVSLPVCRYDRTEDFEKDYLGG